jgi:hypothetical protein
MPDKACTGQVGLLVTLRVSIFWLRVFLLSSASSVTFDEAGLPLQEVLCWGQLCPGSCAAGLRFDTYILLRFKFR